MFEHNKIFIGISPINWTNDDMPFLGSTNNFEQILSEIALTGYSGTEIGIIFPQNIDKIHYHAALRNLKIAGKWFNAYLATMPYAQIEQQFKAEIMQLQAVNASYINVCEMSYNLFRGDNSMFGEKPALSEKQWQNLCTGLNKLGKLAHKHNIKLCYHHHIGTVVQTEEEISFLLNHTEERYVHLCLDTADLTLANIDPVQFILKYGKRIGNVHLKDIYSEKMIEAQKNNYSFRQAIRHNCFTVPGDGNGYVNFQKIFQALNDTAYSGWLIIEAEQNPEIANPFEYALKARYYLSAMLDL